MIFRKYSQTPARDQALSRAMILWGAFIRHSAGSSAMTACAAAAGHTAAARTTAAKAGRTAAEAGRTAAEAGRTTAKPAGTRAAVMMLGRRTAEEAAGRGWIHGMDKGRRGRTAAIAPAPAQSAEYHGENSDPE